ncbi:MAG: gliding motility-associated C-terminal domain-containing protein [Bacteroidetes bacterium]|nr:gliding motility-associated C-terminal domain-containing protein [Bacteroidota bacterium]
MTLSVNSASAVTIKEVLCSGQSIVVGNQTFSTSGTYTITLQNATGCDSVVTLILNIFDGGSKTQVDSTICFGGSVTYAGQTFFQTGTYQIIYPTDLCRDTLLLNLTVNPEIKVTIARTICEGDQYALGNNSYGLTGVYNETFTSALGCDSIVTLNLTVNPVKRTNIDAVLCQGEQVIVGGQVYTESVTNEVITLQTTTGCDSIITLNLIVLKQDTLVTDRSICAGDYAEIGGQRFTSSGTYYIPFQNNQCTGIVQLNLTVIVPSESSITQTICEGEEFTVAGQVFNTTGFYTVIATNAQGCDSVITLNLTVTPKSTSVIDKVICRGETITIGTQTFNASGTYNITLSNASGCDSNVTLNLVVLSSGDTTKISQTICEGESATINGQLFTSTGTYYISVANGNCTDVVELNLTVNSLSQITLDKVLCKGEAIVVGNQTFTETGTYTIVLQNATGCDSIVTLNLNVSEGGGKSQLDTAICFGNSLEFAGQTFSTTGTYQIVYPVDVCRDTLLLNLTVNPVSVLTIGTIIQNCKGSTITVGGQEFSEAGLYTINLTNALGCDSTITLNLAVRICDTPLITITIIDTIPINTDTIYCDLARDSSSTDLVFTACDSISTTGTAPHGTWTINSNGCLVYEGGPIKGTDTLCVLSCDTVTKFCSNTTIIITLTGYPPVAVNDTTKTDPNVPVTIPVLVNDSTFDEDPLTLCSNAIVTQPGHGTLVVNQDGTITYTPVTGYTGVDSFQYQICDPEGRDTAWVYITVEGCVLPNAFSPNGDGINDVFEIPCAEGNVQFSVYNRWGIEVYRNEQYLNDWDGTYKGSPLPDGTYYYVLKYTKSSGEEVNKAGFITLHR